MALRRPARPERAPISLTLVDAATAPAPVSRGLLDNRLVLGFLYSRTSRSPTGSYPWARADARRTAGPACPRTRTTVSAPTARIAVR